MAQNQKSNPLATPLFMLVFALIVFFIVFVLPYYYHLATTPWAGLPGSPNTLNGTWVGKVMIAQDQTSNVHQASDPPHPGVVLLQPHFRFMSSLPMLLGTATICEPGEPREHYTFDIMIPRNGTEISEILRDENHQASRLSATFKNAALTINWHSSDNTSIATGTLHKDTEQAFSTMCQSIGARS